MASLKQQSVLRAFAVLAAFRDPQERLTATEVSRRCSLPETSGHRLLKTLEQAGAVVRGPGGLYRRGMTLVSLSAFTATILQISKSRPHPRALLEPHFDETVQRDETDAQ